MVTETIKIEGMSCAGSCVRSVKQALDEVTGLKVEEVGLGYAKVAYSASSELPILIRQAIQEAGFKAVA
jgi:copper chaperone CopZ